MDTRKLKHFIALCEHGTYHKAAEAIHLSQSALSRSIQMLEQEVGAVLFDRNGHRNQITPFGKSLLVRARRMLFEVAEINRELELMQAGELGEISLAVSPTPASVFLGPCLVALASKHPRVRVSVWMGRTPELVEGLRAEKYDQIVCDSSAISDPNGLEIEHLADQPGDLICRRGHPLLALEKVDLAAIQRYPVACSVVSDDLARLLVSALGPQAHPSRLISVCCDSYDIQRELALHSDAVLMTVFAVVRKELASGELVPLGILPRSLRGRYAIVRLAGRTPSPALHFISAQARRLLAAPEVQSFVMR